jgi:murein tripeptide amidase MpaA
MSRQHSGEVTSSFMVEGMVNYLLSENPTAEYLLNRFVFKIIPMVNIDGVVHGNTRAELMGCDSNRRWADPHK